MTAKDRVGAMSVPGLRVGLLSGFIAISAFAEENVEMKSTNGSAEASTLRVV
jgi:hypothetical protein